jgi:hypothetical protein
MIYDLFPTKIIQVPSLLDLETLQDLYNFVALNKGDIIVTPDELPALKKLQQEVEKHAKSLADEYNFSTVEVSNRFSTHFYPVGKQQGMETHSDDLGDYGRKFIAFFYLEADQDSGGELEIFDPRWTNAPWRDISESFKIIPKTNKLVIFPTFLWHKVNDYYSDFCPRMAIDVVVRIC